MNWTSLRVEVMFPQLQWGSTASNWMLFDSSRAASPRPWTAGTLMLLSTKITNAPISPPMPSSVDADPLIEARRLLTQPVLLMSETITDGYTLGSGWAFVHVPGAQRDWKDPTGAESLRKFRFMDWRIDGHANLLLCFEFSEEYIIFMYVKEENGRENDTYYGLIARSTRQCIIFSRTQNRKNCARCQEHGGTCQCDDTEIEEKFQSEYEQRKDMMARRLTISSLCNAYYESWSSGTFTVANVVQGQRALYTLQTYIQVQGPELQTCVRRVIQAEALGQNSPILSRRFVPRIEHLVNAEDDDETLAVDVIGDFLGARRVAPVNVCPTRELERTSLLMRPAAEADKDGSEPRKETESVGNIAKDSAKEKTHHCCKCEMRFRRRHDLTRHFRAVHEKRRDFQCEQCGREFTHSGHLNSHVRVEHEGNRDFACKICGKIFDAQSKIDRHTQFVHENVRPYSCPFCKKKFKDRYFIRHHMAKQHGVVATAQDPGSPNNMNKDGDNENSAHRIEEATA